MAADPVEQTRTDCRSGPERTPETRGTEACRRSGEDGLHVYAGPRDLHQATLAPHVSDAATKRPGAPYAWALLFSGPAGGGIDLRSTIRVLEPGLRPPDGGPAPSQPRHRASGGLRPLLRWTRPVLISTRGGATGARGGVQFPPHPHCRAWGQFPVQPGLARPWSGARWMPGDPYLDRLVPPPRRASPAPRWGVHEARGGV